MKKILLALNETQFSDGAFEFIRQLNEESPVMLTGLFLPQLSQIALWSYATAINGVPFIPVVEDNNELLQKNIDMFEHRCQMNGITYRVHKDYYDFALPELKKETRFADLLVFSSEKFFSNIKRHTLDIEIIDALQLSECPVVVVPEKFSFPERNILAYDGSASSVYAIKMFTYLFPQLCANETLLIHSDEHADPNLPAEAYIEEFATQHFHNLELRKMSIYPDLYFTDWINQSQQGILVSGSFGRSALSQLFRKSFVYNILTQQRLPLFIAHR